MDITIVIPTYNEENRLEKCLTSICKQDADGFKVKIIIVDDNSSDKTIYIARKYGATIIKSGHRDIEISKYIGLLHTKTELVCFLDADNWFPESSWLADARDAIRENVGIIGAQSAWFNFSKRDPLANRYCTLFGCMDPAVFYLGSSDRLTYTEGRWMPESSIVKEDLNYWVVKISDGDTSTYGSQGFLTFTEDARLYSAGGRFYHTDYVLDSCVKNKKKLIILKNTIGHDGCKDTKQLFNKLYRNISLFQAASDRKYKYNINDIKMTLVATKLITGICPMIDSLVGFLRGPKDIAWFMHVPISFGVGVMYSLIVLRAMIYKKIGRSGDIV